mmetsp:Transcript_13489/g.14830  ORF Transcript_13489/g.14830 Transcript_13489/m.14830 type:complete len:122 (+) Transcript_13489:91-456(+)
MGGADLDMLLCLSRRDLGPKSEEDTDGVVPCRFPTKRKEREKEQETKQQQPQQPEDDASKQHNNTIEGNRTTTQRLILDGEEPKMLVAQNYELKYVECSGVEWSDSDGRASQHEDMLFRVE